RSADSGGRVILLRALHQQLQQLQRHLRDDRGSDRRTRLGVDGQPRPAAGRRIRRRDRTRPATEGRGRCALSAKSLTTDFGMAAADLTAQYSKNNGMLAVQTIASAYASRSPTF